MIVVGGSPGCLSDGEVDAKLLEPVSHLHVDGFDAIGYTEIHATYLHEIGLGDDELTGSDYLGESVEFCHDFATKSDSSDEVITESFTFPEVLGSIGSQEGSHWTTGENPLHQPNLAFPEVPGEEFVGGVDIGSGESKGSHDPANGSLEELLKFAAFSNLEEGVHGSLDVLDERDLSDSTLDAIGNGSGLPDELVPQGSGDAHELAFDSSDNSGGTSANLFDPSPGGSSCSLDTSPNRSGASFDPSPGTSEASLDFVPELDVELIRLKEFFDLLLVLTDLLLKQSKLLVVLRNLGLDLEVLLRHHGVGGYFVTLLDEEVFALRDLFELIRS